MKKMLLFMSFLFMFLLVACGQSSVPSALNCQDGSQPLRVGMNLVYPPFETRDEEDNPIGISVDIATAFGEYLGCEVEIVDVDFASLIDALNLGDIDVIIASMSRTPQREELIMFSDPYMWFKIIGLVNLDYATANGITEDSSVQDILAIETTEFVGISGQVSYSLPLRLNIPETRVTQATDLDSAVSRVVIGDADIMMMSASPVVRNHLVNPDTTLVVWDPFESSPISIGMRQGEDELQGLANTFVASLFEEGGLYEELSVKWDDTVRAILDRYGLEFFLTED